jgi:hypothetical protein
MKMNSIAKNAILDAYTEDYLVLLCVADEVSDMVDNSIHDTRFEFIERYVWENKRYDWGDLYDSLRESLGLAGAIA